MADKSPVIIKKIKKGGHAAHGGAWKVAYADFVTAMMAFFLLLWLLNSVSQEQLEGISNYFAPQSVSASTSGSGGVLGGLSIAQPGAVGNPVSQSPAVADLPAPSAGSGAVSQQPPQPQKQVDQQTAEEVMKKREEEQFKKAEKALREAIDSVPTLKQLKNSLLVDDTPEGLRVQIADQKGVAMFPRGTAQMYDHTREVLGLIAEVIKKMPQKIAIEGHTDATKFQNDQGYSNWELSADRANASRRALIEDGIPESRISRVVGKAAEDPLDKNNPDSPRNRRISILLLRGTGAANEAGANKG